MNYHLIDMQAHGDRRGKLISLAGLKTCLLKSIVFNYDEIMMKEIFYKVVKKNLPFYDFVAV